MNTKEITIGQLRRNVIDTFFQNSYNNLTLGNSEKLSKSNLIHLLKLAIVFLNDGDTNLQKLGYRIITRYSLLYEDYIPWRSFGWVGPW